MARELWSFRFLFLFEHVFLFNDNASENKDAERLEFWISSIFTFTLYFSLYELSCFKVHLDKLLQENFYFEKNMKKKKSYMRKFHFIYNLKNKI